MKRLSACLVLSGFVVSFAVSARAQKSAPSPPSSGSGTGNSQPINPSPAPPNQQIRPPIYVNGRIAAADTGAPIAQPVTVALYCDTKMLETVRTDTRGNFQIALGVGIPSDSSFAPENDPLSDADPLSGPTDIGTAVTDARAPRNYLSDMTGCDLRATVAGYQTVSKFITEPQDRYSVDAGTILMSPVSTGPGGSVSVFALRVPDKARKEFDQGQKDAQKKNFKGAEEDYERAVADYDKYAAWTELGRLYTQDDQADRAQQAFDKAVAADPKYVPTYLDIANIQLQASNSQSAADAAGKALAIDPENAEGNLFMAEAEFNLQHYDDAERNARDAVEANPNLPDAHALLATILLQKRDAGAIAEIHQYLKLAPQGEFAQQFKQQLVQLEKETLAPASDSAPAAATPAATPAQ